MKPNHILFFLTLFVGVHYVHAQKGMLSGTIRSDEEDQTIPFVTISIPALNKGTFSDKSGEYSIEGIPFGDYEVVFSIVGYETKREKISINAPVEHFNVVMAVSVENLEEVTVYGETEEVREARKIQQKVMPVTVITSKDFENRASNLNELLTRQAGVQIRRSGGFGSTSTISVRGLEGKRVQVFIDENPVNTPDGSFGINDIPIQLIERIEIYKGTIPAYLGGDGLGSAVNVVTKHRESSYIDVSIARQSFNTTNSSLILKKSFEEAGIETGVGIFDNRSDNDYVMESPYQDGLEIKRDHDKFHNLLIGASVKFHKLWFDEIEIEGARNDVTKEYQGIQRNIQHAVNDAQTSVLVSNFEKTELLNNKLDIRFNFLKLWIKSMFADTSSYAYNWDGTRIPSLIGLGELGTGPNLSTTQQNEFRTKANANYQVNSSLTLNLNHTFRTSHFHPNDTLGNYYAGRNIYNYDGDLQSSVTGLTGEGKFFNEDLLISTAIKHYYNLVTGFNTNLYVQGDPDKVSNKISRIGYNVGFRYNLTSTFFIKTSHEYALRLPLVAEVFGDGALITPSINLNPEEAYNFTAGAVYDRYLKPGKRIQVETNVFMLDVDNLIQLAGNGLTTGYINYAKAQITGADLDFKYDLTKHFFFSVNATWQSVKDVNEFIPGTNKVPNSTYKKEIPNIPKMFSNWSLEYHRDGLLGSDSNTRAIYEGSYIHEYNYGFELSIYDNFSIPTALSHNLIFEHSFKDQRYTITGQIQNLTNAQIINNWNQPLPGRSFRIKLRFLLLDTRTKH